MRINLMVEGQESVTWPQWLALAEAVEDAGLEGLFRSDHYQSVANRTELSSLDAWATLTALGAVTSRIRLGTMVSPASFRHPSVLAKNVVTADHVSGGRVELGLGAGWHDLEHRTYGFPFHAVGTRYDVLAEQLEIIRRQFQEERFDFAGEHYRLEACEARPKPVQERLPIIMGGQAGPRAAALAARWADEYNTVHPTLDEVRERRANIVRACEQVGREPLVFSVMTGCVVGADEADFRDRAGRLHADEGSDQPLDTWIERRRDVYVMGTVEQAAERLTALEQAGASRVFLQHLLHDEVDEVALLGRLT
ncbi:TIGR03560 family F420-dependent LLM class oxidoreductase [Egicoccus sp. AB-alg2]|uniref:TIGR03560 family F420-dependent LLM class oxidoreductase n=1 Tax=Egicoccus sp. AB-alg2 TaxID=3242693 RepID=UPI00359CBA99